MCDLRLTGDVILKNSEEDKLKIIKDVRRSTPHPPDTRLFTYCIGYRQAKKRSRNFSLVNKVYQVRTAELSVVWIMKFCGHI